jgi:phosphoribosylcarboxyaminoimidazole (NCAIR) mutase
VDRGDNAGHLAVQMLALVNDDMAQKLVQDKLDQIERVLKMDREVNGRA